MKAKSGNYPLHTKCLLILVTILRYLLGPYVCLGEGYVMKAVLLLSSCFSQKYEG